MNVTLACDCAESEFSIADNVSIPLITERSESNVQTLITDMVTKSRTIQTRRVFSRPSFQAWRPTC